MLKLPLRESFSITTIVIAAILASSPLLIALTGFIPYNYSVYGEIIKSPNATVSGMSFYRGLCRAAGSVHVNRTMLLLTYLSFFDLVSATYFLLSGVIAAYLIARPLEYKYFFIEATYSGGRLPIFLLRLGSAYMLGVFSSILGAMNLAGVVYVLKLYSGISEALLSSIELLLLETLIAVSVSSLISLFTRSFPTSTLGVLGILVLILLLGMKYSFLNSIVLVDRILVGDGSIEAYLAALLVSIVGSVWRADMIEY